MLSTLQSTTLAPAARAEAARFEIVSREPFAQGRSFGDAGPYERIIGRVFFSIDPLAARNRAIVDLKHAPVNASGRVEFSADLFLLAPVDPARGNGCLLYDVNNRGNKLALRFFNDSPGGNNPQDPGNGFLMRRGFTVVWSGWDGELLPGNRRLQLRAPVAVSENESLAGLARYEIAPEKNDTRKENTLKPVSGAGHGAYWPTERGLREARLTWRCRPADPRRPIPRNQFTLHVEEHTGRAPTAQLPAVELELPAGFRPGYLYELIYEARAPLVHGVCFAAVRDLISALKHGQGEGNPFGKELVFSRAIGFGVSQSGRFLREFLYSGFNQDEAGRRVFEGLMPHVAGAGLGSFNHRFAQPTAYGTQHEHHDWPTDRFPFAYETQYDPLSKNTDGLLRRALATNTAPKIMHTQSEAEYWSRGGSLVHTDVRGTRDAAPPANVRIYTFGGTQHGPGAYPPKPGVGQAAENPGDYRPQLRALLLALNAWCDTNASPPPSRHPRIDQGTLVGWRQSETHFPRLPGVRYPEVIHQPQWLDFGPHWRSGLITRQPPQVRGVYGVLAPKCGADGNALGCLSPPEVIVPLATHTGWGLRSREAGAEDELVGLKGSYFPLPATHAEGVKSGDPRRSLEERYRDLAGYLRRLSGACRKLVKQGYLLEEDVPRIVARQKKRAAPMFTQAKQEGR